MRKWWLLTEKGHRMTSVMASDLATWSELQGEITHKLHRPGRKATLEAWRSQGSRVETDQPIDRQEMKELFAEHSLGWSAPEMVDLIYKYTGTIVDVDADDLLEELTNIQTYWATAAMVSASTGNDLF